MTSLPTFETLRVQKPSEHVVHVELNRPERRNAMNTAFWREMRELFRSMQQWAGDCRAVVITGAGKHFTSGLDITDIGTDLFCVYTHP